MADMGADNLVRLAMAGLLVSVFLGCGGIVAAFERRPRAFAVLFPLAALAALASTLAILRLGDLAGMGRSYRATLAGACWYQLPPGADLREGRR